jgi:hypothetical protein
MATAPKQQNLTRPKFDDFHQADDMRITSYAGRYYLNPPDANCPATFPVEATTRIQMSGASWPAGQWKTDVETDLKGINRFGSRIMCDSALYNPETNKMNQVPLQAADDENFPLLFQRLVNPPCTLRATGWNRWEALPHQPQLTFETPFDHFIPSRTIDKEKCRTHNGPLTV